jgi:hypothetical protein
MDFEWLLFVLPNLDPGTRRRQQQDQISCEQTSFLQSGHRPEHIYQGYNYYNASERPIGDPVHR